MRVLGLDTTLDACQAAVIDGDRVLAARSVPMQRDHQERLAPMIAEVMAEAGTAFADLDRIGVTVGPGSFTGLRVGLAFAKGLGLALDRPCVGVETLRALGSGHGGLAAAVIDARRDQVYLQLFADDAARSEPMAISLAGAADRLQTFASGRRLVLAGSGAGLVARGLRADIRPEPPHPAVIARLAAGAVEPLGPARPLYLRAPDARLPA